jgi:hypothetical protein
MHGGVLGTRCSECMNPAAHVEYREIYGGQQMRPVCAKHWRCGYCPASAVAVAVLTHYGNTTRTAVCMTHRDQDNSVRAQFGLPLIP